MCLISDLLPRAQHESIPTFLHISSIRNEQAPSNSFAPIEKIILEIEKHKPDAVILGVNLYNGTGGVGLSGK